MIVLHSILVLDCTYTGKGQDPSPLFSEHILESYQKAAAMHFMQQRPMKIGKRAKALKRRSGYFEEELTTTRTKLSNMQVDDMDESEHHEKEHAGISGTGPEAR